VRALIRATVYATICNGFFYRGVDSAQPFRALAQASDIAATKGLRYAERSMLYPWNGEPFPPGPITTIR